MFRATPEDGEADFPTHFERFNNFTEVDYEAALKNLIGTYHASLPADTDVVNGDPTDLPLNCVNVNHLN